MACGSLASFLMIVYYKGLHVATDNLLTLHYLYFYLLYGYLLHSLSHLPLARPLYTSMTSQMYSEDTVHLWTSLHMLVRQKTAHSFIFSGESTC